MLQTLLKQVISSCTDLFKKRYFDGSPGALMHVLTQCHEKSDKHWFRARGCFFSQSEHFLHTFKFKFCSKKKKYSHESSKKKQKKQ